MKTTTHTRLSTHALRAYQLWEQNVATGAYTLVGAYKTAEEVKDQKATRTRNGVRLHVTERIAFNEL